MTLEEKLKVKRITQTEDQKDLDLAGLRKKSEKLQMDEDRPETKQRQ